MRLVRIAGVAVVGMTVLAGCSNGGQANETLPSASPSAAETSESLPPLGPPDLPMPAEAREQTEAGAIAAGRYFIELTVRAYQQGDAEPIADVSRDCDYCESLITGVEEDAAAANRVTGGDVSFRDSGQATLDGNGAEIAFTVQQTALTVTSPDGQMITDRAQPSFQVFTALAATWSSELKAWIVNQVTIT